MDYLSVLGMFKNESHALGEWIEHYLWQGADSIHLIDNNSDDDWSMVKAKYESNPNIHFYTQPKKNYQVYAYWEVIKEHIDTKYLLVADLDEFLYARNGFTHLKNAIEYTPFNFSYLYVPWKIFGSSGHITQPQSIRRDFVWRRRHEQSYACCGKSIFNMEDIKDGQINVHNADPSVYNLSPMSANFQEFPKMGVNTMIHVNEDHLNRANIHCNHYQVQSFEFWTKVKMTRGDIANKDWDNMRNIQNFHECDFNQVKDNELSLMVS